jgi:hypothetical protein
LFATETLAERSPGNPQKAVRCRHGLVRAVAELYFGEQTENSIRQAWGWLRRRIHFNTGILFELLAQRVYPRMPVEKSPDVVYQMKALERLYEKFPAARFIHLLRHPRGHGESNLKYLRLRARNGQVASSHWIYRSGQRENSAAMDPQWGWFRHNMNICAFLEHVPASQQIRIRGEDLLTSPDTELRKIVCWLNLENNDAIIAAMKHPENSPYAFIGPPGARYGSSSKFLENPALRPTKGTTQNLEDPVEWLKGGRGFLPKVKRLARDFGYT